MHVDTSFHIQLCPLALQVSLCLLLSLLSPCILPLTSLIVFNLSPSPILSTFTSHSFFVLLVYNIVHELHILFFLSFFSFLSIYSFFLYLTSSSFSSSHSSFILPPFCPFNIYPFIRYRSRSRYILKQNSIQCN